MWRVALSWLLRVDNTRHSQILTFEQSRYFQVKITISRPNESSSHVGLTALLHIGPLCTGFIHNESKNNLHKKDYFNNFEISTFWRNLTNLEATQVFDEHMPNKWTKKMICVRFFFPFEICTSFVMLEWRKVVTAPSWLSLWLNHELQPDFKPF